MKRRTFFEQLIKLTAITGISAITVAGIFPELFVLRRKSKKIVFGKKDEVFIDAPYVVKKVDDLTLIIKKDGDGTFTAFSTACTHGGCPVEWAESDQKFFCRCHGGVFDANGRPISGPPKKPLTQYPVRERIQTQELFVYIGNEDS
ncbi:MAG: ubiquinol-cytochrome c reductase iron-sulfur subunit [Candidatus Kapaibacteriota bacterium]